MGNTGSCVGRSGAPKKKGDAPATPHGIPLPPGLPTLVEATPTTIHIEWDKPSSDGGAEIFAYIVKMMRDGGSAWKKLDADVEELEFTAKNLEPGEKYKFYVQCENDNGVSKPSEITEPLATKTYEFTLTPSNDTNENIKETRESSANKYEVKEEEEEEKKENEEDRKSAKSDDSCDSNISNRNSSSSSSHHSQESTKKETTQETHQTKQVSKTTESSSTEEKVEESEHSSQTVVTTETVRTTHIVSAVSNDKDFAVESNDDVGQGQTLSRFAYSYSNDSLLDDDEDDQIEKQNRFNEQYNVTVHSNSSSTMEEYHTIDNEIPDQHHFVMPLQQLVADPNESYRLSIISERSTEETNSPDPRVSPTKTGSQFTFTKRVFTGQEFEETGEMDGDDSTTKVRGNAVPTRNMTNTERKPLESRIPMKSSSISTSSLSSSTTIISSTTTSSSTQEFKQTTSQSRLPMLKKHDCSEEAKSERKSSIPEIERKSSVPELERKSSIPRIPRATSSSKVPARRDSLEKSQNPSGKIPSGEDINRNRTTTLPRHIVSPSSKSGIPTGGARRGSRSEDAPTKPASRIPGLGAKSGIPPPRISSS